MRARGGDETDWARVDALTEMQLEAAIASDPDWADIPRDWYKHAKPYYPKEHKKQVTLRIDPDVLDWFKRQGRGYQTRINAALRAFVEAHERKWAPGSFADAGCGARPFPGWHHGLGSVQIRRTGSPLLGRSARPQVGPRDVRNRS
jgi:uncharacterized protein (DUF4415 family)